MTELSPYLSFRDSARAAMTYYQGIFGGQLDLQTFADFGQTDAPHSELVMHARLSTPDGLVLMAADTPPGRPFTLGNTMTVSLSGEDAGLRDWFARLAEGGTVTMPLEKQVWGDEFGMCIDQFGTPWMVNVVAGDSAGD